MILKLSAELARGTQRYLADRNNLLRSLLEYFWRRFVGSLRISKMFNIKKFTLNFNGNYPERLLYLVHTGECQVQLFMPFRLQQRRVKRMNAGGYTIKWESKSEEETKGER